MGEECDDGNTASGDACSSSCLAEVCGNSRLDGNEECDDGNTAAGDGCSQLCRREFCGDGSLTPAPVPTAATLIWTASGCQPEGQGQVRLSVNGREVLSGSLDNTCSCDMTVREITTTNPQVLSAFSPSGQNFLLFEITGIGSSNSLRGWATLRLSGVPLREVVIFDSGQAGDAEARRGALCASGEAEYVFGDSVRGAIAPPWGPEECDDGNAIPGDGCSDTCQLGGCGDGRRTPDEECDDGNTDNGDGCSAACLIEGCSFCNPQTGECGSKQDGFACGDGNACTLQDACQQGFCVGSSTTTCAPPTACQQPGVCDPQSGACTFTPRPNGVSCSDGNACTRSDSCQAGACVGANPVVCVASDACHDAETCNPTTGQCPQVAKPEGATCNDQDPLHPERPLPAGRLPRARPGGLQHQRRLSGAAGHLRAAAGLPVSRSLRRDVLR